MVYKTDISITQFTGYNLVAFHREFLWYDGYLLVYGEKLLIIKSVHHAGRTAGQNMN